MTKKTIKGIVICSLVIVLLACNVPINFSTPPPEDPTLKAAAMSLLIQTYIAQTSAADPASIAKTMVAGTQTASALLNPPVIVVPQQAGPTDTPIPQQPQQPIPPVIPVQEGVFLTLSANTYCRTGPAAVFPRVTTIMVGQKVKVIARNPENDTYYIENPNAPGNYCWLWGQYATLTGDQSTLYVYTPQPTPFPTYTSTPAIGFSLSYSNLENCGGSYTLGLKIQNTGTVTWQSISIQISDLTTAFTAVETVNQFRTYNGCVATVTQEDLTAGEVAVVSAVDPGHFFNYDPTGHNISVLVTVCAQDGMGGPCMFKSMNIVP
jgi:hypothetical protein